MNEATRNEIVQLWNGGLSMRAIARRLDVSRHAVRHLLARQQSDRNAGPRSAELSPPRRRRARPLDAYEATMRDLLSRYPDITAMRLHEELRSAGFGGGYTAVKERLRALRPAPLVTPVQRFETSPGVQAQMDYATYDIDFSHEGRRRVYLFGYVLSYSRRQYLRFVESQDFPTTIRQHVCAFQHLGGVAVTCLYDNMKVVVAGFDGEEPVYNTRFLAFATHYGFRPWACRRRRPQTKGKVERQFHYVETSLLNGRSFRSLEHLNEVTAWWLEHVADVRRHRETKQTPLARHAQERSRLVPLPQHAYDTAEVLYRTVNAEGLIAYRQNRYSVPWHYIGRIVVVRVTQEELIVYGPHLDEMTRHVLLPRTAAGQTSCRTEHQPQDDPRKKYDLLKARFDELGAGGGRFLEGLVETRRYGKDEAQKVLALLGIYSRDDLRAALDRAVRHGAFSLRAVERILAVQARPKTALDTLADREQEHLRPLLDRLGMPPRDTAAYEPLLPDPPSQEPPHETPPQPPPEPGPEPPATP